MSGGARRSPRLRALRRSTSCGVPAVLLALAVGAAAAGPGYEELRAAAVAACRAIDPAEFQSGLLFNPDGHRSYYVRSECFQRAAVQFRDAALCAEVKRRWSLFSSSWGYSGRRCRELVAEGVAADLASLNALKQRWREGALHLRELRVERNGNGRDFDVVPSFAGAFAHGHVLRLELVGAGKGGADALLHDSGYWIDAGSQLWIFLRQAEIRQQVPGFALGRPYTLRATLVLGVGFGGPAGYQSDAFVERVFPERERSHSLEREVRF
jgi:hypothetical protein